MPNSKLAITDFTIQSIGSAGPQYEHGWEFFPTDLNATVRGNYIYCGFQQGTTDPVTEVNFIAYDGAQSATIPGWKWSPEDLNKGAKGQYIYMYWRRGNGHKPITSMTFLVTSSSTPPQISGYTQVGCDLNKGAGGEYIWAYYSNTAQPFAFKEELFERA
tara:strand:+ start:205 stop:684 length:480 start_codon:yes stop_codon:yes gene_type:complete